MLADLLLVDEAAAIPTPLLEAMLPVTVALSSLQRSTAMRGRRGFHLRFKKVPDEQTPD